MSSEGHSEIENVAPEATERPSEIAAPEKSQKEIEREQEVQLRSKYPDMRGPGTSALLQKRMSQRSKYFDSGDYAMAKAKGGTTVAAKQPAPPGISVPAPELTTGDAIPTPENVHQRKQANRLSKLVSM